MKTGKTTVATFSDLEKANEVKKQLEAAGISAEVQDESNLQKFLFFSKPLAADKVLVDEKDFEKARQFLKAADAQDHLLSGEVRCPKCGSARIDYPQFTRKFMTTALIEVFCLLHVVDKEFFCKDCQHMWPVEETLREKTDILQWPDKSGEMVKKEKH